MVTGRRRPRWVLLKMQDTSSPDGQTTRMIDSPAEAGWWAGCGRSHPAGLPEGVPDHPGGVKRWSVLDTPGPARQRRAQAAGMTPLALPIGG
jgi:hypothetical protein